MKIILDLCGGTGSWSKPYKDAGYDVQIIDPLVDGQDVRLFKLPREVHGILAAPPCTHLSGSGALHWAKKGPEALLEAMSIVDACIRVITFSKPVWWALENPVGRLVHYIGKPKLIFNPCDYGDPYTKKTCLWGEFNLPQTNPVEPTGYNHTLKFSPSKDRWRLRSMTPQGFAKAFFEANK